MNLVFKIDIFDRKELMKKYILSIAVLIFLASCQENKTRNKEQSAESKIKRKLNMSQINIVVQNENGDKIDSMVLESKTDSVESLTNQVFTAVDNRDLFNKMKTIGVKLVESFYKIKALKNSK